jgi:hypothetical protein
MPEIATTDVWRAANLMRKLDQQVSERGLSLVLLTRAAERIHQLLDLRFYAFQKIFSTEVLPGGSA